MTGGQIRRIPGNSEHPVAWLLWHMARIEDVTMNLLVAGEPQLFSRENWPERLGVSVCNTGNAMGEDWVRQLSVAVDVEALLDYRLAVGRRTREIAEGLRPEELKQKVNPARLGRVLDEGAVVPEAQGLVDYWSRRTIAGLLLYFNLCQFSALTAALLQLCRCWPARQTPIVRSPSLPVA